MQDPQHVAQARAAKRGNDADRTRQEWQRPLARLIKQALSAAGAA